MGSARPPVAFILRLLALLALIAVVGLVYQSVENFIPYWDYARVEKLFHALAEAFDGGVIHGFSWLLHQVNNVEYNSIFALPLMVAADLIGASRDRIVLAVLLVHLGLYLVAFAFLIRKVFGYRSVNEVSILQLGSALLLPSVFTATMLGFETVAVLPVLTLALIAFLAASWPDEEQSDGRRMALFFLAGTLLASTFLIRRAYAYTVINFYFTAGLLVVGEVALGRLAWWSREMWVRVVGMAAAGLGTLAILLGLARDRVFSVLATPYHDLYAAWKITPVEAGRQLLASVGGIVLLAAAAGFLFRRFVVPVPRRVMAVLLGLTGTLGFLQWIFLVKLRMRLDKPMLYAPMIALGIALLFTGRDEKRWSNLLRGFCFAVLVVNLGISLGALPEVKAAKRVVFAHPLPPLVRSDMAEYRDLVDWLRSETVDDTGRGEAILVLAASGDINDSLIKDAEIYFYGWGNHILNVPPYNTVDRTSNYPVWLHSADWVLLARPFQFHTSAEERRLIRFGWDEFVEHRGLSRNFECLDETWIVGRDPKKTVELEVWRRTAPDTLAELLDLLDRAKEFVIHHPVFPDLWVEDQAPFAFSSSRIKRKGEHYSLHFTLGQGRRAATSAVLMQPLAADTEIRFEPEVIRGSSDNTVLIAEFLDDSGIRTGVERILHTKTVIIGGRGPVEVAIRAPDEGATLLRLRLERRSQSRMNGPLLRVRTRVEILDPNQALTGGDMHHLSRSEHFRKYSTYPRVHLRFSEVSEHQDLGASHPPLALGLGLDHPR